MTLGTACERAVIVHGLEMARSALEAGRLARRLPVLLSAPGAGAYAGVGWWRALMQQAGAAEHILDCGPAPGRALEALRMGQTRLVLQADARVWADIAGRARACGATLYAQPPLALDLGQPGAHRRLTAWLLDPDAELGDTAATFG